MSLLKKRLRNFTKQKKLNLSQKFYARLSAKCIFRYLIPFGCSTLRICNIFVRVFTGVVLGSVTR
ncbi:hypothetical protein D3C85_1552040 [compost metagenome]